MIRRGKAQGWLHADPSSISPWAAFHGIDFGGVEIVHTDGKGVGLIATSPTQDVLIRVPRELVLSQENVALHAKTDLHFRSLLEAIGDFGRTARGSILTFMLFQATRSCPDLDENIGVASPLTKYVQFLPMENLPTFWTSEEIELLTGTSLAPAVTAKLKSLHREFHLLRTSTEDIPWCSDHWWQQPDGLITFDDWKQVDSFYRTRALEFPGIGDCMVPFIDISNHASGAETRALYESDSEGNAILIPREGFPLNAEDEVTITYGDEKGACEMIFSYGFLEESMDSAKTIFLDLDIPDTDPLKPAKQAVTISAPGVRLLQEAPDRLRWTSDYVWLLCVNEEDGLAIDVLQTNSGEREIQITWKDEVLSDLTNMEQSLRADSLWPIYQLRAVVILQNRIAHQLGAIYGNEEVITERCQSPNVRAGPKILALRLRELEAELLEQFYEHFENERYRLAEVPEVREYLGRTADTESSDRSEDFS